MRADDGASPLEKGCTHFIVRDQELEERFHVSSVEGQFAQCMNVSVSIHVKVCMKYVPTVDLNSVCLMPV